MLPCALGRSLGAALALVKVIQFLELAGGAGRFLPSLFLLRRHVLPPGHHARDALVWICLHLAFDFHRLGLRFKLHARDKTAGAQAVRDLGGQPRGGVDLGLEALHRYRRLREHGRIAQGQRHFKGCQAAQDALPFGDGCRARVGFVGKSGAQTLAVARHAGHDAAAPRIALVTCQNARTPL